MLTETNNKSQKQFLAGGSQLGDLINSKDWSDTPLGPLESWPQSLKTSVNLILNSRHPMWIGWGPEATFLYNDAYIQVLSLAKHPWALGRPASEVWAEIWDVCGPLAEKVFKKGEATYVEDVLLFMNRGDFIEETYYSFSYSPIYDEAGKISGLFCPSAETTEKVLHTRRLKTLSELSSKALLAKTNKAACITSFETLKKNPDDIPFAALYLVDAEKRFAHLEQSTFTEGLRDFFPGRVRLTPDHDEDVTWAVGEVIRTKVAKKLMLDGLDEIPTGRAGNIMKEAIVLPVTSSGQETPIGVLVAGVNPCRALDSDYLTFYDLLSNHIATAIQNARAAEEERKRVEMLAEVDKAKTVFFSNVSHEFRTPITLILGPVEEILRNSGHLLPPQHREDLKSIQRNTMRLSMLVNTLLDFSRIEAGRISANYTPTNLPAFTEDLASNFRSVIENAGLEFVISCDPVAEPVYVDRQMWEKIVFNLLSNAFKYTLAGQITIRLFQEGSNVVLKVRDTGIGIPAAELPRMFERFHRVKQSTGRTFEGTGIGLSLVRELIKLHNGAVEVTSTEGEGSTFTVTIPLGKSHLPVSEVVEHTDNLYQSALAGVYVKGVESLMAQSALEPNLDAHLPREKGSETSGKRQTILIVDDNADMRNYMKRLLGDRYSILEAENGKQALEQAGKLTPQLIISDIMMPVMDGIQFLETIKKDTHFAHIPVILLSARAGEEARIEGFELGADDYLVKPFSANELLARVKSQLNISRLRLHAESHLRNLFQQAPVIIVVFRGPEFIIEIANEKLLQYWNKELNDVLHKPLLEVLPEIANQGLIELLTHVLTTGERKLEHEREVPLYRDGKLENTYVSYVYEPLRNEEGEITNVMVLANDVTESVLARKKIEASEAKFRNLVIQAPVGIVILRGPDLVVEIANESYLQIANRTAQELTGKPIFDVLTDLRETPLAGFLNSVLETGKPYFGSEFPVEFFRNGKLDLAYFNFVYQPLMEDSRVDGVVGVVVEVTEIVKSRKIAQELATDLERRVNERTQELTLSNNKLEASNRELEEFAYIASHDLQEPLRKIQTFSELLQRNLDERQTANKYIGKIDESASRMSLLIKDVLNYSKLSKTDEPFSPVDLNQILENVKSDFELLIHETNAVIIHDTLPEIRGIALQLYQLFANLIGNSLKFFRESPVIKISCETLSDEMVNQHPRLIADKSYVRLTFSDNGIGFEQEYADKIFVIFQRLNYQGKHLGTGIGLALCKKIVENHQGFIEASGEVNKGATFKVYLPMPSKPHPLNSNGI